MNWLKPEKITPGEYDPENAVNLFIKKEGGVGQLILEIFNHEDPLNCYFEINSDEYLSHAKRVIEKLRQLFVEPEKLSFDIIYSCVRDSFYPSQIEKKFVTEDKIKNIAENIFQQLPDLLKSKNRREKQD